MGVFDDDWATRFAMLLDAYLALLLRRRDAALAAGNTRRVAECEDRIIRCELFLANLGQWELRRQR